MMMMMMMMMILRLELNNMCKKCELCMVSRTEKAWSILCQASVGHATKTNMAPKKSVEPPEAALSTMGITGITINANSFNNDDTKMY